MQPFAARALVVLIALFAIGTTPHPVRADAIGDVEGVARISYLHGDVDIVRADSGNTVAAALNAPFAVGDTLVTHTNARAELELDFGTLVRVAPESQLRFSRIDTTDHRLQLALGSVELRVFRNRGQNATVEAPQATLVPKAPGRFRVTVAGNGDADLGARSGTASVKSESGSRVLAAGESLAVTGSYAAPTLHAVVSYDTDDFDRWTDTRDEQLVRAREGAYLDRGLVGAADLDFAGRWLDDPRYGRVWSPDEDAGWAPYHDGRFVWEPYYGWTWVAAEPWGWAPYHYGNWFYGASGWCWYPGAAFVYRPAVVAFVSFGSGFAFGFGYIGWVPLAPFEPFFPWYGRHVTVVNNMTNVTVNNAPPAAAAGGLNDTIYHNVNAPGGFVAVQSADFASGRFARVDNVKPIALSHATVVRGVVPIVPTAQNLAPTSKAPAASAAVAPSRIFAHFEPPTMRVRPFDRERSDIRATGNVVYPTAPTVTTVVPHANTPTSQRTLPTMRATGIDGTMGVPHAIDVPHAAGITPTTDRSVRAPSVTILSNGTNERFASPWDRFRDRTPTVILGHPAASSGDPLRSRIDAAHDRTVPNDVRNDNVRIDGHRIEGVGSDTVRGNVERGNVERGNVVRAESADVFPSAPRRSLPPNDTIRATNPGASVSRDRAPVERSAVERAPVERASADNGAHVMHGMIVEHASVRTH